MLEAQPRGRRRRRRRRRRLTMHPVAATLLAATLPSKDTQLSIAGGLFPTTRPARPFNFLLFFFLFLLSLYARPGNHLSCGPAYPGKAWSPVIGPMLVRPELTIRPHPTTTCIFVFLTAQCDGKEREPKNLLKRKSLCSVSALVFYLVHSLCALRAISRRTDATVRINQTDHRPQRPQTLIINVSSLP